MYALGCVGRFPRLLTWVGSWVCLALPQTFPLLTIQVQKRCALGYVWHFPKHSNCCHVRFPRLLTLQVCSGVCLALPWDIPIVDNLGIEEVCSGVCLALPQTFQLLSCQVQKQLLLNMAGTPLGMHFLFVRFPRLLTLQVCSGVCLALSQTFPLWTSQVWKRYALGYVWHFPRHSDCCHVRYRSGCYGIWLALPQECNSYFFKIIAQHFMAKFY